MVAVEERWTEGELGQPKQRAAESHSCPPCPKTNLLSMKLRHRLIESQARSTGQELGPDNLELRTEAGEELVKT